MVDSEKTGESGKTKIIGLTGTNGAGKGEAAAFFISYGYQYHSLSDLIRDELTNKGLEITRDHLIREGNRMREEGGADILARMIMVKIQGKTVIDSIRSPFEIEYLKAAPGFLLLGIDAPAEIRYQRVLQRGRRESISDFEEFKAKEAEEMSDSETGQQLHRCMRMVDRLIINDGSLDKFHEKLEEFI